MARVIWLIFLIAVIAGGYLFFQSDRGRELWNDIKAQFEGEVEKAEDRIEEEVDQKQDEVKEELKNELKQQTNDAIDSL